MKLKLLPYGRSQTKNDHDDGGDDAGSADDTDDKQQIVLVTAIDIVSALKFSVLWPTTAATLFEEVKTQHGLFALTDIIDFGLVEFGARSRRQTFFAYSTVERGIEIDSVYVDDATHATNGVYLQFSSQPPISLKSAARNQPGQNFFGIKTLFCTIRVF